MPRLGLGITRDSFVPWKPDKISNLEYWFRGDLDLESDGGTVHAWTDQIKGYKLTASADANRPATASINGQPGIQGDGSDDILSGSAFEHAMNSFTIFIIDTVASDNDSSRILFNGNKTSGSSTLASHGAGPSPEYLLAFGELQTTGETLPAGGTVEFSLITNIGAEDLWYSNGADVYSYEAGTNPVDFLSLLGRPYITYLCSDSKICEIGLITGSLSATDLTKLEKYAQGRYGITAW